MCWFFLLVDIIPEGTQGHEDYALQVKETKSRKIHLPSRQQAQYYLANLLQEMNTEDAAVLMPVESVLELARKT
jgi:hypothetical protein